MESELVDIPRGLMYRAGTPLRVGRVQVDNRRDFVTLRMKLALLKIILYLVITVK